MPQNQEKITESSLGYNHTLRILLSKNELESPENVEFLGQKLAQTLKKYQRVRVIAEFVEEQDPPAERGDPNDI